MSGVLATPAYECPACRAANRAGSRFCEACGARLCDRCPGCDTTIRVGQNFCGECGTTLRPTVMPAPAHPAAAPRIPGGAAPAPVAPEGERKNGTLLAVDTVDSTAILNSLGNEEGAAIIQRVMHVVRSVVLRYEGMIDNTAGDGLMAMFGAPMAQEDHAIRGCYAAIEIQEAVRACSDEVRGTCGVQVQVRIGIHSGPVILQVAGLAADGRPSLTLSGISIHLARRLEAAATPGSTLISNDAFLLAEGFVHAAGLGAMRFKGFEAPVEVHELKGVNTRMRMHALAARGLNRFVGRSEEIALLRRGAASTLDGHGQVVAFVGEAGVGKSRLLWEFTRSPELRGWLVLEAGSVSYGKATSYTPIVDFLKRYFEIEPDDDARRVGERVAGRLYALDAQHLSEQRSIFLGALGLEVTDEPWASMRPRDRQARIFDTLRHLLIQESRLQPLCVVFEDLQWIDPQTEAFLDLLSTSIPAARVLLLVNFRPEYQNRWVPSSHFSLARLAPLPGARAEELLAGLLGPDPGLAEIRKAVLARAAGNPLFLEESVRGLAETGVLEGVSGCYRVARMPTGSFVPQTIQALLAARIDRLPADRKELLQIAAVVGNEVPQTLLARVVDQPVASIEEPMRDLQRAEFLFEATLFPEVEYTFKHSMTREVAYTGLLAARRKALHARVAIAVESLYAHRIAEQAERIAYHAEQGDLHALAAPWLHKAGHRALARNAIEEAVDYFDRACTVLKLLPETPDTLAAGVDARFDLRNALLALGHTVRVGAVLRDAEPLLDRLGDPIRTASLAVFLSNHHFLAADQTQAIAACERGLASARAGHDRAMESELLFRLGQSHSALGDYRLATDLLRQSLALADQGPTTRPRQSGNAAIPSVARRTWLAYGLAQLGEFTTGVAHASAALAAAESANHPLSTVMATWAGGYVLLAKGELDGAIATLERGLAACDRWQIRVWRPRLAASLTLARARAGRLDGAEVMAREALDAAAAMQLTVDRAMMLVTLGEVLLLAGDRAGALGCATEASAIARKQGEAAHEAWALWLAQAAGDAVALLPDQPATGDRDAARAIAARLGLTPLLQRLGPG